MKDAIYRLRDAVKITWDKSKMEDSFREMHQSNSDLQQLGEQVRKIQESSSRRPKEDALKAQLPQEYADFGAIRRASKAFHTALSNAWTQDNGYSLITAPRHEVRFFLDAKVSDSVCMNMVVVCPGHEAANR